MKITPGVRIITWATVAAVTAMYGIQYYNDGYKCWPLPVGYVIVDVLFMFDAYRDLLRKSDV